jgi:hypothetical protein
LTYGNVVATLALFLALSGGVVYAANKITSKQLGKGAVKNKNLAKNAVKAKNLAKNAVSSPKIAKDAVKNADIADGAVNFAKLAAGTDVVASSTGGPVGVNQDLATIPLNPPLTVTPVAGQPLTVNLEARGTLMPSGTSTCQAFPLPVVNGNPMLVGELAVLSSPDNPPEQPFPNGIPVSGVSFPVGVSQPGVAQSIGVQLLTENPEDCAAGSRIDQVAVVVTQGK